MDGAAHRSPGRQRWFGQGWKRLALILAALFVVGSLWSIWVPKVAPVGAVSGPVVAAVFDEAMRTGSTERLLRHARSVPGTRICFVSTTPFLKRGVRRGGASDAGVPHYVLEERVWAFILVRPNGPAEFVIRPSGQVSPQGTVECLRAEDADITLSRAVPSGPKFGYLTLTPLRR